RRARTTAAASCGSTSRRTHASTSRTSARLRKETSEPSGGASSAICEAATTPGYERRRGESSARSSAGADLSGYAPLVDVVDWRIAQRIGERVAGSPPPGGV